MDFEAIMCLDVRCLCFDCTTKLSLCLIPGSKVGDDAEGLKQRKKLMEGHDLRAVGVWGLGFGFEFRFWIWDVGSRVGSQI